MDKKNNIPIDEKFFAILWKPSALKFVPKGVTFLPFGIWWVMHYLRIFSNQDYSIFLIYDQKNLIHRSVITPKYFRFPFMDKDDLQIGDTYTSRLYRGKGLATFAIKMACQSHMKSGRRFWYVVEETNISSKTAIENAGFKKVGVGIRKKRIGMRVLGVYEIQYHF